MAMLALRADLATDIVDADALRQPQGDLRILDGRRGHPRCTLNARHRHDQRGEGKGQTMKPGAEHEPDIQPNARPVNRQLQPRDSPPLGCEARGLRIARVSP